MSLLDFDRPQWVDSQGCRLATYVGGAADGPDILLVHGWPELAYSWKNQIEPLVTAGYRVIAYDLRGFGASDVPLEVSEYTLQKLVTDMEAIMNAYDIERAVVCGHDWGGAIVWQAGQILGERICAIISICTPLMPPAPIDPIELFKSRFGAEHYMVHFNEYPGVAEALFEQNPEAFFDMMFRHTRKAQPLTPRMTHIPKQFADYLAAGTPPLFGHIMDLRERAYYAQAYRCTGFQGGLNLYRNITANWQSTRHIPLHVAQPSLLLAPEYDLILPPEMSDHMFALIENFERRILTDCGHWAMWEQPEQVNAHLLDWLAEHVPVKI